MCFLNVYVFSANIKELAFYGQGRFLREDEVKGKGREISKIIS